MSDEKPKVYCFSTARDGGAGTAFGLAEDGTVLAHHGCSDESFVPGDLGSTSHNCAKYEAHYPDGFAVEFVSAARIAKHEGLWGAMSHVLFSAIDFGPKIPLTEPETADEITGTAIHVVRQPRGQPVLIAVRWDEGTPEGTPFRWNYVGLKNTRDSDVFPFRVRTGLDENVVYDLEEEDRCDCGFTRQSKPEFRPTHCNGCKFDEPTYQKQAKDLEQEMDEAFALIPPRFRVEEDLSGAIRNVVAALENKEPTLEERIARLEASVGLCDNCAAVKAGGGHWPETGRYAALAPRPERPEHEKVMLDPPRRNAAQELDRLTQRFVDCDGDIHAINELIDGDGLTALKLLGLLSDFMGGSS